MKAEIRELLQNRNYRKDLSAEIINRFGDSVDAIASSWIVYEITGQASWSALIYALNRIPTIILTPLAGPWVERKNKKMIMVITDLIRAICVGLLATGLLMGFLNAPMIAVLSLVISSAEAFRVPAGTALFPQIVPEHLYGEAMSISKAASGTVELVGTAVAAVIIALIGSSGAIYVDMITFILSALIILSMKLKDDSNKNAERFNVSGYMRDLKDGFLYCATKKRLVAITMIILFLNGILVPLNSLQTPMVSELLHGDAFFLSAFGATFVASMLVGSLIFPMIYKRLDAKMVLVMVSVAITAVYFILVAASPLYTNRYVALGILVVLTVILGLFVTIANMFLGVESYRIIDKEYLARTSSIGNALGSAIMPVTAGLISGLLKFSNVAQIFLGAGVVAIVFCIVLIAKGNLEEQETTDNADMREAA
ncbi:Transmembrane secretion effector [Butyrivibrio sp. ob235]|uniref:MFS transporter n=1 Tax=Butyrivibrio sp. ob235 TaxID=1761780 RepID=UPI0008D54865|nr:MFS transporter [Butyrivibrio sp. ob235]SEM61163.1 Transmembrane secretion effector [Butyrivibrio sp. ob235]